MRRAYVGQDAKQVAKKGSKKCSWYVFWEEPNGRRRTKSFGPGRQGKAAADRYRDRVNVSIAEGSYVSTTSVWSEFRESFVANVLSQKSPGHAGEVLRSLEHFERIVSPTRLASIDTQTIDRFIHKRRLERGIKKASKISVATINKDLRNIRLVLRVAHE